MAFSDSPIVDRNSERSEASVLAVRGALCRRNGFICREETPDYGVDIDVELVIAEGASGYRFVIQIKSSEKLTKIKCGDEDFISYQFLTSRIGYLCQSAPGYGIIVLYDDLSGTSYFDFVESIYERISSEKPPSVWQEQKYVNIHIPTTNILDDSSASKIYETYRRRFANFEMLMKQNAARYGIPVFPKPILNVIDPNNMQSVIDILTEYGAALFNRHDLAVLDGLISRIPPKEVEDSPELSFIAAITYGEAGYLVKAQYYLRHAKDFGERLSGERRALLDLYSAENDFRFGTGDIEEYISVLRQISDRLDSVYNKLNILVRVDRLSVLAAIGFANRDKQKAMLAQVNQTQKAIREAGIDADSRDILLIAVAGNLHQIGISLLVSSITAMRIRVKTFGPIPEEERAQEAGRILKIINNSTDLLEEVYEGLEKRSAGDFLRAYASNQICSTFFSFVFNSFMSNAGEPSWTQDVQRLFSSRYDIALSAFNAFVKMGILDAAYSALTTALELRVLHNQSFSAPISSPPDGELEGRIEAIGQELGYVSYVSLVRKFVDETLPELKKSSTRLFAEIRPGHEHEFASTYAEALRLPGSRIGNIVADIIANREFYESIPDSEAELLQNLEHATSLSTIYHDKVTYIGHCKKCGFRTNPSRSINTIIGDYILQHGKTCLLL